MAHFPAAAAFARVEGGIVRVAPDTLPGPVAAERAWSAVRVLQVAAPPHQTPVGAFVNHLIMMNLGEDASAGAQIDGGDWVPHRIPRHGVTVFPAGVLHVARVEAARELLYAEITREFADRVLSASSPGGAIQPVLGAEDPFATHLLLALAAETGAGARLSDPGAGALASALVGRLAAADVSVAHAEPVSELPSRKLRAVLEYVATHLDAPLTLRTLARLAGMDLFRFARAFKQGTGMSPHRYVLDVRIAHAKELLCNRALSITEIALRTGFATPSHFSVTFRRMTGTTPRGHRDALPKP